MNKHARHGWLLPLAIFAMATLSPAAFLSFEAETGTCGMLSTTSPPLSGNLTAASNLTLTWPLACAGFTLQTRTNLNTGNWLNSSSATPQIVGGRWQTIISVPGNGVGSTFYRLAK